MRQKNADFSSHQVLSECIVNEKVKLLTHNIKYGNCFVFVMNIGK